MSGVLRRLLLDSNVVDAVLDNDELLRLLIEAVRSGASHLLITHVQIDEILATGSKQRKADLVRVLAALPAERIPTYGFIVGMSRLENARLVDDDGAKFIEVLRGNGPKPRTNDAVLIATAHFEKATFVSNDKQAVKTAKRNDVSAITPKDLVLHLRTR